jgi:hypothetical protein
MALGTATGQGREEGQNITYTLTCFFSFKTEVPHEPKKKKERKKETKEK